MPITTETKQTMAEAGQEALVELISDGLSEEEATDIVVQVLDSILNWHFLLKGPLLAGALEATDGVAIEKAVEAIKSLIRDIASPDPDKIEERAERAESRGHSKIAARRMARAARLRVKQGE